MGSWPQQGRNQQAEMLLRCFKTLPSHAPSMGGQVLAMRPAPPTPSWGVARVPRSKPSLELGASVKTRPSGASQWCQSSSVEWVVGHCCNSAVLMVGTSHARLGSQGFLHRPDLGLLSRHGGHPHSQGRLMNASASRGERWQGACGAAACMLHTAPHFSAHSVPQCLRHELSALHAAGSRREQERTHKPKDPPHPHSHPQQPTTLTEAETPTHQHPNTPQAAERDWAQQVRTKFHTTTHTP